MSPYRLADAQPPREAVRTVRGTFAARLGAFWPLERDIEVLVFLGVSLGLAALLCTAR